MINKPKTTLSRKPKRGTPKGVPQAAFSDSEWPRERFRSRAANVGTEPVLVDDQTSIGGQRSVTALEGVSRYDHSRQLMLDLIGGTRFYKDTINYRHDLFFNGRKGLRDGTDKAEEYLALDIEVQAGLYRTLELPARYALSAIDRQISAPYSGQASAAFKLPGLLQHYNLEEHARTGHKAIDISLRESFNLLAFIAQYADAKRIFLRYFTKRGWHDTLTLFTKQNGKHSLGSLARGVANSHLEHQFGTTPFIRDVRTLLKIFRDWIERADRLREHANGKHSYHMGVVSLPLPRQYHEFSFPFFGLTSSKICLTDDFGTGLTIHSNIEYRYSVPGLTGFLGRLAQMSDAFGIHLGSAVWELIRFSWVADWFTNIGQWIFEQAESDWYECQVSIDDYCRSGKVVVKRQIDWEYEQSSSFLTGGAPLLNRVRVADTSTGYFVREVDQPPDLAVNPLLELREDPWTVKRFQVAAALVVQRTPTRDKVVSQADALYKDVRRAILWYRRADYLRKRQDVLDYRFQKKQYKRRILALKEQIRHTRGLERARLRVKLAQVYGGKAIDYDDRPNPISSKRPIDPKTGKLLPRKQPSAITRLRMIQSQQSSIEHIMSKI